ncbi:atrial natriuretic peptide receptor 2-like [Paramacrobiotus metropolitanus]|uniref:atrial natriuretic peptide receptor 2-like n=1 Tax=Paramacrobiotus metropolitanus TaxID=2943436 RepID=UPI00244569CF|nr:atrial natriuretic peptide receptor 2-like [Paramacrobiotus metropolitanus]
MIYGMWKPPYLQGLPFIAPGFELAVDRVNEAYAGVLNFRMDIVASQSVQQCPDISANYYLIAERYYRLLENGTQAVAVFYAGCDAFTTVADFGREWDLLAINVGPTFSTLRNRIVYPTSIALGPSQYEIYGVMVGQLSTAYSWNSIAIVYDISGLTVWHLRVSQEIGQFMRQNYDHVDVHAFPVDTRDSIDFEPIIKDISVLTRVVFLAMPVNTTEQFLLTFASSGETREEYVHIYLDFLGSFRSPLERVFPDNDTLTVTTLWQSLFVMAICFEHDNTKIAELRKEMKALAIGKYNATFRNPGAGFQTNEFVTTAYSAVLLYAEVLSETVNAGNEPRDGTHLAGAMLNRTFALPIVGSVYIDQNGERQNVICLYTFYTEQRRFVRARYFDSATYTLRTVPNITMNWGTSNNRPPLSEPVCGFRRDKGPCAKLAPSVIGGIVSGVVLVVIALLFIVPTFIGQRKHTVDDDWWVVDLRYLSHAVISGSSSKVSEHSHPCSFKSNLINATMSYRGRTVWVKVVKFTQDNARLPSHQETIRPTREFRALLNEIRSLTDRCCNVNPLIGIGLGPVRLLYLTALCPKGNLSNLMEDIHLDWSLKCSLIADLIEGVSAIHRTAIRRHGNLRPSKCLIDSRLVLKINEVGLYDTVHELQVKVVNSKELKTVGQSLQNAWVAPELRTNLMENLAFSRAAWQTQPSADIYAVGCLIRYILQDPADQTDDLADFDLAALANQHDIPRNAVPILSNLLHQCHSAEPMDRPNIWQVKLEIGRIVANQGKLLDQLLRRLEEYALQLENAVSLRTHTLKQEMEKCDSLLGEMLPRYVLVQLRTGNLVQPQIFPSVTILMTHVAGFDEFVSKCESDPLEIVIFLNSMFTIFDRVLAKFDCYKVETITDCCLVASGLPVENNGEHVHIIADVALEMRELFEQSFLWERLRLKAGIHSGSCAAGVVGTARPRYCVFGDSVNVTSRLASSSQSGKIQISYSTEALLRTDKLFKVDERGLTYLKGIGTVMTFWLDG